MVRPTLFLCLLVVTARASGSAQTQSFDGAICNLSVPVKQFPATFPATRTPDLTQRSFDNVCSTYEPPGRWYAIAGDGNCYAVSVEIKNATMTRQIDIMSAVARNNREACGELKCIKSVLAPGDKTLSVKLETKEGSRFYANVITDDTYTLEVQVRDWFVWIGHGRSGSYS